MARTKGLEMLRKGPVAVWVYLCFGNLQPFFGLESFGWSHVSSCDKRYSELIIPNNERPLFQ
jgi:hypothetical protein